MQEEDMLTIISTSFINKEIKDNQIWGGDISGEFSIKFAYECLAFQDLGNLMAFSINFGKLKRFPMI